jgi:mannose-6-phosphate isomerase-like protein (cupin superfamily)
MVSCTSNHGANMKFSAINFNEKFTKFSEHWSPRIIAEMNEYQFKLVKVAGEFVWHDHPETDEVFIVIEGCLTIEFRDGIVSLESGEMFVIPKGVEHKPSASSECKIMIVEPKGIINTGDTGGDLTAENDLWV